MTILIRLIKSPILKKTGETEEKRRKAKHYFSSALDSMSINKKRFLLCFAALLLFAGLAAAQDFEATIKVSSSGASVTGKLLKQCGENWSFLKSVANAEKLGARVSDFELLDENNRAVSSKKLIEGEFLAEEKACGFQYQINLESLANVATTRAHVSWLEGEQGILMTGDLLPQFSIENQPFAGQIEFELPPDWKIISSEKNIGKNVFDVRDVNAGVFAVGKDWRETSSANLNLAISGEWQFEDAEAAQMANDIYEEYKKLFGENPRKKTQIFLAPLPKDARFGRWEAETRGANLTILSAGKPFKSQSIQLLHEQLRHELFHLWIPNNLNLDGNYDWFYEGFTVYQALRTGVATNQIRFEDFLATLAEARHSDNFQTSRTSLIESSKNRWNGTHSQIYARGMLVAFLSDVAVLKDSGGKRSIENIFQEIYQKHRFPNTKANGNAAISDVLKNYAPLAAIVERYIEDAEKIAWETDLQTLGIETNSENSFPKLQVKANLSGKQKDLLNKLGYNNWRKISRKSK